MKRARERAAAGDCVRMQQKADVGVCAQGKRVAGGEAPSSTADALHKQVDKHGEQRKSGGFKGENRLHS